MVEEKQLTHTFRYRGYLTQNQGLAPPGNHSVDAECVALHLKYVSPLLIKSS